MLLGARTLFLALFYLVISYLVPLTYLGKWSALMTHDNATSGSTCCRLDALSVTRLVSGSGWLTCHADTAHAHTCLSLW
jgi:hypothetical protein